MERRKNTAALVSLAGALLILLNILMISMSSAPLLVSSSAATVDTALKSAAPLWWRIALGVRGYTEGIGLALGLIAATIMLYCSMSLFLRPRNVGPLSSLVMLLSAVALLYGGGFIIGSVLAFIGAALNYETPKPSNETFMGKMLSALRASPRLFQHFMNDSSVRDAAMVVIFANLLSGIGNGVYTFNAERIINAPNANTPFQVLFAGGLQFDISIVQTPIILMGLGIVKWALLSLILFLVGVRLFGEKASLASVAACAGFAYVPIALQLFTSFVFTSKPYLTMWSGALFLLTNVWMILILMAGMKHVMSISYTKAAATVATCGAIYTLTNYLFFTQVSVPYVITFQIEPPQAMLLITSIFIAIPAFFMGRKQQSSG
jgi:hypothetical protein